jgi:hypothetical protein
LGNHPIQNSHPKPQKKQLFTELKQAATIPRQSSGHPQRNTATTALLLS